MGTFLMVSTFFAPILFSFLKKYKLSGAVTIALVFSMIMLHQFHNVATTGAFVNQTKMFLFLAQSLNVCAAILTVIQVYKNKIMISKSYENKLSKKHLSSIEKNEEQIQSKFEERA